MAVKAFVYDANAVGKYFDPFLHKKFVFVLERKLLVRSLGEEVLVRVYKLPNREFYLGIVFLDGLVRDGLTVIRDVKRGVYYPIGYMDEVGHWEVWSHSMKGVFMKVANLKRFRDVSDMPIKTENVDPLDAVSYWNLVDVFYGNPSYEELKPFLVLRTGRGELHLSLLKRLNRDNIDLYITENPGEEKLLVVGKAGERYLVRWGWIAIRVNLKEAFHFLREINKEFRIEEALVLNEEAYTRTGLSSILSEMAASLTSQQTHKV